MALSAAALVACAPQPEVAQGDQAAQAADVHPESGLVIIPVTVTQDGESTTFRTELALSEDAQSRGMMFRTEMAPDEAMLFPSEPARIRSFWMRNTLIPLDLIFIGPDRRILNIQTDAQPYSEAPLRSAGPVIGVLEIPGGRAAELGIEAGAQVAWQVPAE